MQTLTFGHWVKMHLLHPYQVVPAILADRIPVPVKILETYQRHWKTKRFSKIAYTVNLPKKKKTLRFPQNLRKPLE